MNPNRFDEVAQSGAFDAFPDLDKTVSLIQDVVLETGLSVDDALAVSRGIEKELAANPELEGASVQDEDSEGAFSTITQTRTHVFAIDKINNVRAALGVGSYQELLQEWIGNMARAGASLESTEQSKANNNYYLKLGREVTSHARPSTI